MIAYEIVRCSSGRTGVRAKAWRHCDSGTTYGVQVHAVRGGGASTAAERSVLAPARQARRSMTGRQRP